MFCKYCGAEIADDSVFCSKCGKNISEKAETRTEEKPKVEESPSVPVSIPEPSAGLKPDTWYYTDGTETEGPLYAELLKKKILNGIISNRVKVRQDPKDPWIPMMESPFRKTAIASTKAPIHILDKWVWCLAIVPITVLYLIEYFHLFPPENYMDWIASVAINGIFLFLDKKELEKDGFYPEAWMWMGFVLVPVYLIVREVKTNRNFVPAIIWCFLFAIVTFVL